MVRNIAYVIKLSEQCNRLNPIGRFNITLSVQLYKKPYGFVGGPITRASQFVLHPSVCVNERVATSTFLCLLTTHNVLGSLQQTTYDNHVRNMTSGGLLENVRSGLGCVKSKTEDT